MGDSLSRRLLLIGLEVQLPMILASWIERTTALGANGPTLHVLVDGENVLALAA